MINESLIFKAPFEVVDGVFVEDTGWVAQNEIALIIFEGVNLVLSPGGKVIKCSIDNIGYGSQNIVFLLQIVDESCLFRWIFLLQSFLTSQWPGMAILLGSWLLF
jgi:hypothetical protein